MENNFIKDKLSNWVAYIGGVIFHGAMPISIDYIFHKFNYTIYFTIVMILSLLIYRLTNKYLTKITVKKWENSAKYLLISTITIIIIISLFLVRYGGLTKNGFAYIKGKTYTEVAKDAKLTDLISDNDLVDSFSENVGMVYTDFEFYERIFSILWISFIASIDLMVCCELKSKKKKRKNYGN